MREDHLFATYCLETPKAAAALARAWGSRFGGSSSFGLSATLPPVYWLPWSPPAALCWGVRIIAGLMVPKQTTPSYAVTTDRTRDSLTTESGSAMPSALASGSIGDVTRGQLWTYYVRNQARVGSGWIRPLQGSVGALVVGSMLGEGCRIGSHEG